MIVNGDAGEYLNTCSPFRAAFMDPPDNIGLSYSGYNDRLPTGVYYSWLESLVTRAMAKAGVVWVSHYFKHELAVSNIIYRLLREQYAGWEYRKIIWHFTFGQYRDNDLSNGYRPIACLVKMGEKLNYDAIRITSARMALGDPRAAGPRVPDDVWDFPRIVGNARERRSWHPTQHPEALMERIMLLSCSPDEHFVDLFGGTGTSLRVGKRLGMNTTVVEIDPDYCQKIREENP